MKPAPVVISAAMLMVPGAGAVSARNALPAKSYLGQNFLYRGYCGDRQLYTAYRFAKGRWLPAVRAGAAA